MRVNVVATMHSGYMAEKEEFDNFGGKAAGVCYMPNSFEDLINEDKAKTDRRIFQTKESGHHSVYDHLSISLYLENIPKILAMLLNNEKMYTTSEKSGRYTKMALEGKSYEIYYKWLEKFKILIKNKYQKEYPSFFTDAKIEKLAQESARYTTPAFTLVSMVHTISYRQLNYVYSFLKKLLSDISEENFILKLKPHVKEFLSEMEKNIPYLDKLLQDDGKSRTQSLINSYKPEEYFGDVYATTYKLTFSAFAQAQRHRTLHYTICIPKEEEYYVPPIFEGDEKLAEEWLLDLKCQKEEFPQALLLEVHEYGTLENFILKLKERKCTYAQLEINNQVNNMLNKYIENLEKTNHPKKDYLKIYTNGSRCTFKDYKCSTPCGFIEGIKETRRI